MPKVFLSSTKNWSDTTLVSGTNCLIRTGSAVDAVKYQSLSAGSSYNVLERTGTGINNVQYKQETAIYSAAQNAQNAYNILKQWCFSEASDKCCIKCVSDVDWDDGTDVGYSALSSSISLDTLNAKIRFSQGTTGMLRNTVALGFPMFYLTSGTINDKNDPTRGLLKAEFAGADSYSPSRNITFTFDSQRKIIKCTSNTPYIYYARHGTRSGYAEHYSTVWKYVDFYYKAE